MIEFWRFYKFGLVLEVILVQQLSVINPTVALEKPYLHIPKLDKLLTLLHSELILLQEAMDNFAFLDNF